ncbi:MAG: hypothetical protein H3C49_05950 [Alphaproteobacteria bacterium]|nr:hypothetical protein [Alphaproteobacteria bacterium]HRI77237.1 hypothetical protein [Alphaproteobacteria bacterium]
MSARKQKKISLEQRLVKRRQDLLARIDDALAAEMPGKKSAADTFLQLKRLETEAEYLREDILSHARRGADEKRFWTAFGINTPLVAGLLLLEPITGTMAVLTTVLTGYAPTTLIKRILDDAKMGDAVAIKAVQMDIETVHIAQSRIQSRCSAIEAAHVETIADVSGHHALFKEYPDLRLHFMEKAFRAQQAVLAANNKPASAANNNAAPAPDSAPRKAPLKNHRRFGL